MSSVNYDRMAKTPQQEPSLVVDPLSSPETDDEGSVMCGMHLQDLSAGQGAFINLGFSEVDDKAGAGHVTSELQYTADLLEGAHNQWQEYQDAIAKNYQEVRDQIEARKREVLELVAEHAQSLQNELDLMLQSHVDHAESAMLNIQSLYQNLQVVADQVPDLNQMSQDETEPNLDKNDNQANYIHAMEQVLEIQRNINNSVPIWLPLRLNTAAPTTYLISHMLGNIKTVDTDEYPLQLCSQLELIHKFSMKTKYDTLPCGIVDMSLATNGAIIAADKQNNLVKMFDKSGDFIKIIGQEHLRDPNRVSVMRSTNTILVADNYVKFVKKFNSEGDYLDIYTNNLQYPTSLCESYKGEVIITEYTSKSMMVLDSAGVVQHQFPIRMTSPAHVSCGPRGHVVVTDWRNHAIKVFHLDGECVWKLSGKGSSNTQLDQPQGACFDSYGHLLLADTNNHRIQCFDEDGNFIKCIVGKSDGLRLPMSVKCDNTGLLYVAEYQGNIKIYRYLEKIKETDMSVEGQLDPQMVTSFGDASPRLQSKNASPCHRTDRGRSPGPMAHSSPSSRRNSSTNVSPSHQGNHSVPVSPRKNGNHLNFPTEPLLQSDMLQSETHSNNASPRHQRHNGSSSNRCSPLPSSRRVEPIGAPADIVTTLSQASVENIASIASEEDAKLLTEEETSF